jgi:transcriptional regulator with XRE-family HTH domain
MSEYGETLARYRDEAGLSQRELGAAIGLDYTQLNKIEHGHRPPLRAKYMKPLVRALRLEREQADNLVDLAGQSRKVLDFMDKDSEAKEEEQASARLLPTLANLAITLPSSLLLGTIGDEIEEIKRLIKSVSFTDEENEVVASHLYTLKRLLKFIAAQRKI